MKKSVIKVSAVCLCAVLALGGLGSASSLAAGTERSVSAEPTAAVQKLSAAGEEPQLAAKDETVYVLAGADGAVQEIIVSDWMKNCGNSDSLRDFSELTDVENVKGEESFTLSGDNMRVWNAQGNDIYYQGRIEKELPVDLTVSYTLDGEPVSPQDLAGRSGRVRIRFDYVNNQYETAEINGRQERIYVPFTMLTGVLLDNDRFHNVEVSNGKLYNDGERTAVIGVALPGLQETLAIDAEKLELPGCVEITADVENFALGTTMTLAVSDLFGQLDTDALDSTEDLSASLDELTEAMEQLTDGSSRLYDGLCTLLDRSAELVGGINRLAAGTEALKTGADGLESGAAQLQEGAAALDAGLTSLSGSSAALNTGAEQIFDSLLASANAQLSAAGVQLPTELTEENYAQLLDGLIAAMPAGTEPVVRLKASLDGYQQFYQGLQSYTAGVDQAAAGAGNLSTGAAQLSGGAAQLSEGAAQLQEGVHTLKNGAPALVDGVTQLRDGAMELSDGLKEFDEKGVQRLVDAVDGDLDGLAARIRAAAEASRNYTSFAGRSADMDGQVKFVYRTESIESAE